MQGGSQERYLEKVIAIHDVGLFLDVVDDAGLFLAVVDDVGLFLAVVNYVGFVWSTVEVLRNALLVAFAFVAGVSVHCFFIVMRVSALEVVPRLQILPRHFALILEFFEFRAIFAKYTRYTYKHPC